jgi:hypothetical protein
MIRVPHQRNLHRTGLAAALIMGLAACSSHEAPQWQLSLSSRQATSGQGRLTLVDPDSWAVAVAHRPHRMGAVFSTQRLVSEWDDFYQEPAAGQLNDLDVTVGAPEVSQGGVTFSTQAALPATLDTTSLVLPYRAGLRYSFDLAPATGWTYVVTFGPGFIRDSTLDARFTSPTTVAFAADRHRSMATAAALPLFSGPAYLVLLDNREYKVVPVTLRRASLSGDLLTLETDNAPPADLNRGALFVDGLPTPA